MVVAVPTLSIGETLGDTGSGGHRQALSLKGSLFLEHALLSPLQRPRPGALGIEGHGDRCWGGSPRVRVNYNQAALQSPLRPYKGSAAWRLSPPTGDGAGPQLGQSAQLCRSRQSRSSGHLRCDGDPKD